VCSSDLHSWAFLHAAEKISGTVVPERSLMIRAMLLELERMYSHIGDIGGIALDVGFSQPAAFASIIKENVHQLNDRICGHRYLRGVLAPGGVSQHIDLKDRSMINNALSRSLNDLNDLKKTLLSSVSFLDRVDTTGHLNKKIAEDLGVLGLSGRASGIDIDLRRDMPSIYSELVIPSSIEHSGDVLARLLLRFEEFEWSVKMIKDLLLKISDGNDIGSFAAKEGSSLGYTEGWRGPVLYWLSLNKEGVI
jgi:Ni,Fe-hydrogenase III large subunit